MKTRLIAFAVLVFTAVGGQSTFRGAVPLRSPAIRTSLEVPQSDPQPCKREDLTIKEGETDAAMGGVRRAPFTFTNVSTMPCTLKGYVSLELLNKAGALVKRAIKQKSDDPISANILAPGKTAWFALDFNSGGAGYMGKPCPTYPRVRITLPGAARPFNLRSQITTCVKSTFEVTPIAAGSPD